VAKFRAARRLWAKVMRERFGAKDPRSWMLRFHTQTGGATLTAQQPLNNLVRTAFQGLAAVLGGTQSLHTNSYDEALALPSEHAATLALRSQQIIAFETGAADTIDPVAGSPFMEQLTDWVEQEAREYIERIDGMGGALAGIEAGYQQREIHESAYRMQKAIEEKRRIVVGVNDFLDGDEGRGAAILRVDPEIGRRQVARLQALRQKRDAAAVESSLGRIRAAARGGENLMPLFIDAVERYVTLGEICDVLREVWGEQREFIAV
jgi:methylmalonyl-CoA mutase N-terminal domain/subunit